MVREMPYEGSLPNLRHKKKGRSGSESVSLSHHEISSTGLGIST